MSIRTLGLAVCAFAAVTVGTALAVSAVVPARLSPTEVITSRESTRTLDALEATTPVPSTATPPVAEIVTQQAQPRVPTPEKRREFDVKAAMAHIRALEAFGPRAGGGAAETAAAVYLRDQLVSFGLDARVEEFPLPNGTTSRNVVARIQGSSDTLLVLGGHFDTKPPSPGANDNASGCGALLEIAEILAEKPTVPTVEIVFFGSEEIVGNDPEDHHFGSRYRLARMPAAERAATAGMISVDMIGYGPDFHSRTMGKGPRTLSNMLVAHARVLGIPMTYLIDPGKSGWSDHEPYELAGVPVSWVEWRDDPAYHTVGDVSTHLSPAKIATAGKLVLDFTRSLDEAELARLCDR